MDSRGNLYDDPTEEQICALKLLRLPYIPDRFDKEPAQAMPVLSRRDRRMQSRKLAKSGRQ